MAFQEGYSGYGYDAQAVAAKLSVGSKKAQSIPNDLRLVSVFYRKSLTKTVVKLTVTSCCSLVVDSTAVELSLIGSSASSGNATETSGFQDLFKAMLHNVPVKVGILAGFTLRCESFALKVVFYVCILISFFTITHCDVSL